MTASKPTSKHVCISKSVCVSKNQCTRGKLIKLLLGSYCLGLHPSFTCLYLCVLGRLYNIFFTQFLQTHMNAQKMKL